jgi:RimJ/RimL family protein N-acetyltransferase
MTAVLKLVPRRNAYRIVTNEKERVSRWVCERLGTHHAGDNVQAIGHELNGEIIGGVLYDNYNGATIEMHCAGVGRWLTRTFLNAVFDYPFNGIGVHKVVGLVDEANMAARKLDAHLGFVHEATIKDGAKGGDLLILTMTREQCRFLGD